MECHWGVRFFAPHAAPWRLCFLTVQVLGRRYGDDTRRGAINWRGERPAGCSVRFSAGLHMFLTSSGARRLCLIIACTCHVTPFSSTLPKPLLALRSPNTYKAPRYPAAKMAKNIMLQLRKLSSPPSSFHRGTTWLNISSLSRTAPKTPSVHPQSQEE